MESDPWADAPSPPRPEARGATPRKPAFQAPFHAAFATIDTPQAVASSSSPRPSPPLPFASTNHAAEQPTFDEFDDFDDTAPAAIPEGAEDDGFGDFGDFEEGDFAALTEDQAGTTILPGDEVKPPKVVEGKWVNSRMGMTT